MDSILQSIKKLIGIDKNYDKFDTDIIMHINSAFAVLTQLGVGPNGGFYISDEQDFWTDFLPKKSKKFQDSKTYVYLKVKLVFDPPPSASLIELMKQEIKELEWRLNVDAEDKTEHTDIPIEDVTDGDEVKY